MVLINLIFQMRKLSLPELKGLPTIQTCIQPLTSRSMTPPHTPMFAPSQEVSDIQREEWGDGAGDAGLEFSGSQHKSQLSFPGVKKKKKTPEPLNTLLSHQYQKQG